MREISQRDIGAYFTPPRVSQYIVEEAINGYLLAKIEKKLNYNSESFDSFINTSKPQMIERAFRDILVPIKILDPAVGDGVFLLGAIDVLSAISCHLIKRLGPDFQTSDQLLANFLDLASCNRKKLMSQLRQYFGSNCIYGVDIYPHSVEKARSKIKRSIFSRSDSPRRESNSVPLIDFHLVIGNSLIGFDKPLFNGIREFPALKELCSQLCRLKSQFRYNPASNKIKNQLLEVQQDLKEQVDVHYRKLIHFKLGTDLSAEIKPFHWFVNFPEAMFSGGFDVIVGNPPFLDSKRWNYAATARASFEVNYGILRQAGNADMFAYFIEKGIRLLKPGGSFGLILSDKWLDVGFGVCLKQFLLDQTHLCRVEMVDQGIFPAASVDCVIIFGKRKNDGKNGEKLQTAFIRVPKAYNLWNTNGAESGYGISRQIIESSFLSPKKRWGTFLKAPEIYYDIISSSKLEPLESNALIKRGITTGANRFFFLNEETKASYNISEEFVSPIVDSPRSLKGYIIGDLPLYVLAIPKNISQEALPEGVRRYIDEGEKKEFHRRRMIQARKPWYSLPLTQPAPILAAKMMDKTPVFYLNPSGFFANNVFYEITPKKEQILSVWLYLNSTIAHLLIELQGRSYQGGVLEIAAFELKRFLCLSLSELLKFSDITQKINPYLRPFTQKKQVIVDKMILRILGLEDRYTELKNAVSTLQKYRLTKKRKDEIN